ncbi:MAG: endonuclease [Archangium sp.]|nr:endonuclease [Archangium sp.]
MRLKLLLAVSVVGVLSCGPPPSGSDGGPDAAVSSDASVQFDAGVMDAGFDAGSPDAGADAGLDAGEEDAGVDAGELDAGVDAGEVDAGFDAGMDAGELDAGFDGGEPDAGIDAGIDAGFDAGMLDPFDAGAGCPVPTMMSAPFMVRAMAANLTSGNNQRYDPGHGMRIIAGVAPDIVMVQEFSYFTSSVSDMNSMVNQMFPDAGYVWTRGAGSIPNGIISRWPIIASGEWIDSLASSTRNFTWARIDVPGPADLWVVSVHLLTSSAANRNNQGNQIINNMNVMIPANDWVLVGGDLNTDTRDAGQEPVFNTFATRLVVQGPFPVDQLGNPHTSLPRSKPYDQVLPSPCLRALQVPTVIGMSVYPSGAVIDTRVYTPLSEIAPAQFGDSNAPSMQHMGVLRDFLIQP